METKRNYGIDLLRLVLMFMVCLLHTLGQGGVLRSISGKSLSSGILWLLEIISYGAVDAFALISGYMAKDKPCRYEKIVNMWFQVFFYSFIVTAGLYLFGVRGNIRKIDFLWNAMPVFGKKYWYFSAYFLSFLSAPILNRYLFQMDKILQKKMLLFLFLSFSVFGILTDSFSTSGGYSAIWLIALYCIGVLIKQSGIFDNVKSFLLAGIWFLCITATWAAQYVLGKAKLTSYISPTILLSSIMIVVLFSRIKPRCTKWIAKLSPLAFGVYLLQLNQIIWHTYVVKASEYTAGKSLPITLLSVFAFAAVLFAAGLLVEFLRSLAARLIGIPKLSKWIVSLCDNFLDRVVHIFH